MTSKDIVLKDIAWIGVGSYLPGGKSHNVHISLATCSIHSSPLLQVTENVFQYKEIN